MKGGRGESYIGMHKESRTLGSPRKTLPLQHMPLKMIQAETVLLIPSPPIFQTLSKKHNIESKIEQHLYN